MHLVHPELLLPVLYRTLQEAHPPPAQLAVKNAHVAPFFASCFSGQAR